MTTMTTSIYALRVCFVAVVCISLLGTNGLSTAPGFCSQRINQ